MKRKYDITVIIPSLNPDEKLNEVVKNLEKEGFDDIIIIDDGSDEAHKGNFPSVKEHPSCTILTHETNKGKGAALKTAFSYFLDNRPDRAGVVTADGDNQHRAYDIAACAREMIESKAVIIGARDFASNDVPFHNKAGNKITSGIFKLLFGMKISDTQTGLRAIPREYLDELLKVSGDRYEYETNALIIMKPAKIPYAEVPIETVYINKNETSHFRPVRDSIRIYGMILKFLFSSISSFAIDIIAFNLAFLLLKPTGIKEYTAISFVIARLISSSYNFIVNKKLVFNSKGNIMKKILRYIILAAFVLVVSAGVVQLFAYVVTDNQLIINIIKILVDMIMFILSFRIQKGWVFNDR